VKSIQVSLNVFTNLSGCILNSLKN